MASALGIVLALGLAGLPGCSSCGGGESTPDASGVVELSEVPAPDGLVMELFVDKPGQTWGKLRDLGGGAARLLPQSFGLFASTFLGLPATAADSIDPELPVTGAACALENGELASVIAIHVRNGRELTARLSAGGDASYSARTDSASGITLLEPKPGKASQDVALGVLGNYLIAALHSADLTKVGPYAVRTLPKRPAPSTPIAITLQKQALSGPLSARIEALWKQKRSELSVLDKQNRDKHGGRAPDFGDPAAALAGMDAAVKGFTQLLSSSSGGRVAVNPLADRLELRVEIDAEKSGPLAELLSGMVVGDAKPILALPATTPVAVMTRTSRTSRDASAKSMTQGIADLFGDRLAAPDRDKVEHAFADLAAGRGDWETYGLMLGGGGGGLVYRAGLSDPKAFNSGAKGLFRLLALKAFAEPLRQFIGDVSVKQTTATVPGVSGNVERALVDIKPSGMRKALDKSGKTTNESKPVEVLWSAGSDKVFGALSLDAVPLLGKLVADESDPKATHASESQVAEALGRVKDAGFVVLVQPLELDPRHSASLLPSAPIVVSFGKTDKSAVIAADAHKEALDSVVKSFALGR